MYSCLFILIYFRSPTKYFEKNIFFKYNVFFLNIFSLLYIKHALYMKIILQYLKINDNKIIIIICFYNKLIDITYSLQGI